MKFPIRICAFLFAFALAAFAPLAVAGAQPACAEYCYEPIPAPGDAGGKSPHRPERTPSEDGSVSDSPADLQVNEESDSAITGSPGAELADRLGVSAKQRKATQRAKTKQAKSKKQDQRRRVKDREEEEPVAGLGAVEPPKGGDSQAGSASLGLLLALVAIAALVAGATVLARTRSGAGTGGTAIRLGALGVMLIALLLAGTGTAFAKRAAVPKGFFGILPQEAVTEEDAERMSRGGLESVRIPVPWGQVQKERGGPFDWSLIDTQVAAASKYGLRVLPIMYDTSPGYGPNSARMPVYNAVQRQGWANFLREAVRRYGPGGTFWQEHYGEFTPVAIRNWQIWNEPNFHFFAKPVSVPRYLQLLKISRRALRSEDARSKIMLGGLYGSPREIRGKAMKSFNFLDQLYRRGGRRFFDSIAIHAYTPNNQQLNRLLNAVERTLIRRKARRTPIHLTEIGWGSDRRTVFGKRTPAGQARQLTTGYRLLIRRQRKLNLRSVYWFSWKDLSPDRPGCNFCYSTGLFWAGEGLVAKPAWNRLVRLAGGSW